MLSAIIASKDTAFFVAGHGPCSGINHFRIACIEDYGIDRQSALLYSGLEPPPRASAIRRAENLSVSRAEVQQVGIIGRGNQRANVATPRPGYFPLPNFFRAGGRSNYATRVVAAHSRGRAHEQQREEGKQAIQSHWVNGTP